jgi:tetratricopeptide (TPR) repeat protein
MNIKRLFLIVALLLAICKPTFAQDTDDPATNYKAALALNTEGKGLEAVPYLEKVLKTQSNYTDAAYILLGSIYDKSNQPEKAITVYQEGLKIYPKDQNLYFNLGIASFRAKKYADAELAAVEAIKLDRKHANSQRLYGLVTFHQNKRLNALMAFCSFLLLEPNGPRTEEAITNMQSILKGGVLRAEGANKTLNAETKLFNAIINQSIASSKTKNLNGAALLTYQLKTIFTQAGQATVKKPTKTFFDQFYIAFFHQMAQSGHVPAFAKLINDETENTALTDWVKTTERNF